MLTPQQEQYCKNRALKKMSQRKAYRAAYPEAQTWQDNSVDVEACRLEAETNISLRLKELRDEQTAEILKENKWNRDKAFDDLTWLKEKAKKEIEETNSVSSSTANAILGCIKELNDIYEVRAETTERESDGFIEALNGKAGEVWSDEETGDIPI